jgi:hypothetical protein
MKGARANCDDIFKGASCFYPNNIIIGVEAEVAVAKEILDILGCFHILGSC